MVYNKKPQMQPKCNGKSAPVSSMAEQHLMDLTFLHITTIQNNHDLKILENVEKQADLEKGNITRWVTCFYSF